MSDEFVADVKLRGIERVITDRREARVFLSLELFDYGLESTLRDLLVPEVLPAGVRSQRMLYLTNKNRSDGVLDLTDVPTDDLMRELTRRLAG